MQRRYAVLSAAIISLIISCKSNESKNDSEPQKETAVATGAGNTIELPAPDKSNMKLCEVIGWPANKTPVAPKGFTVTKFAGGLDNPRWIYVAPNGDIFVSQATTESKGVSKIKNDISGKSKSQNMGASPNSIILLRDANKDGIPETKEIFLSGLNKPFGMLIMNNSFYVANTDGIFQYPYKEGQTKMIATGKTILTLPAGGYNNHWTRNLFASKDGKKIFVTVGSGSNVGEHGIDNEVRRANILEINPDGSGEKVFAAGLRNPQGLGYAPGTSTLWVAVNERDELGDKLVPDYMTSVKDGGFYGWPYSYYGQHVDTRVKEQQPDLVKRAIVPDVPLGAHTASLGLAFDEKNNFPGRYAGGAFVGQHGSWNSSILVGYRVAFVPFQNGKPTGPPEDFLAGFIADHDNGKVYGRPVGVAFAKDGAMLVADDSGNTIWRVAADKK